MALDPNITLMAGQAPSMFEALQRGIQAEQAIRQAPIIEALQMARLQQAQQQVQQAPVVAQQQQQIRQGQIDAQELQNRVAQSGLSMTEAQNRARVISQFAGRALQIQDPAQREAFKRSIDPQALAAVGISQEEAMQFPIDDQSLSNLKQSSDIILSVAPQDKALELRERELEERIEARKTEASRRREIEQARIQGQIEGGAGQLVAEKEAGKAAIKASGEAADKIPVIQDSIRIYDEMLETLAEGAGTGAVQSRLPSVKAASIKLDNLQKKLGLNVIQNTTFGALSEKELDFALDSELPKNLDEAALAEWIHNKKESQQKLLDYVQEAAIFLGTPGNTRADWVQLQKSRELSKDKGAEAQQPQQAPAAAGQIQFLGFE